MAADRHDVEPDTDVDVIVVGAGQAGLATGFVLQRSGLTFRLFDRAARVGDSWRRRHDSLVLFSTRAYSALPGLPMAGDPDGYPTKNEIADYLEEYANVYDLPITLRDGIARLTRRRDHFAAVTDRGLQIAAQAVIVATGAFQRGIVPPFSRRLSEEVLQLTADTYRGPSQLPDGRVLVVGGGATGRQIAYELSSSRDVSLSTGRSPGITPQRVFGRDVMAWFDVLGFLRADKSTGKGRFARAHESFPGWHLRSAALRRHGVRLRPRTVDAPSGHCRFIDGSTDQFHAVIWATGYRDDAAWLQIPDAVDAAGNLVEHRGVSPVPGLFHVGRSWQTSRASALLCGVAFDAGTIVRHVTESLKHSQRIGAQSVGGLHPTDAERLEQSSWRTS